MFFTHFRPFGIDLQYFYLVKMVKKNFQGSQYVRMYGVIFENLQKCTELGIRTSVHDNFKDFWVFEDPYMGF